MSYFRRLRQNAGTVRFILLLLCVPIFAVGLYFDWLFGIWPTAYLMAAAAVFIGHSLRSFFGIYPRQAVMALMGVQVAFAGVGVAINFFDVLLSPAFWIGFQFAVVLYWTCLVGFYSHPEIVLENDDFLDEASDE